MEEQPVEHASSSHTYRAGRRVYHARHARVSWGGLILLFAGVVLLLSNFGLLDSSVWDELWRFWPLLLVFTGLDLLLGRTRTGRFMVLFIAILCLLGILAVSLASPVVGHDGRDAAQRIRELPEHWQQ